jgi:DNA-directed RNA polymerase specialized sigma24 family protein
MPPAAVSDAELVRRSLSRDQRAVDELCSRHVGRLHALAYRLTGTHDRAVAFVEAMFVRTFSRLEEIEREGLDFPAALAMAAKDLFLEGADPGCVEAADALSVASVALPPRQRLVLALREVGLFGYAEIAALVDLTETEVARTIADARERLRVQLGISEGRRPDTRALCRMMVPLLSAHLDGETKGMRLEDVTEHLERCERCRAELADLEELQRRYRTLIPPPALDALIEGVAAALAASGALTARAAGSSRRRFVAAGALAAL